MPPKAAAAAPKTKTIPPKAAAPKAKTMPPQAPSQPTAKTMPQQAPPETESKRRSTAAHRLYLACAKNPGMAAAVRSLQKQAAAAKRSVECDVDDDDDEDAAPPAPKAKRATRALTPKRVYSEIEVQQDLVKWYRKGLENAEAELARLEAAEAQRPTRSQESSGSAAAPQ